MRYRGPALPPFRIHRCLVRNPDTFPLYPYTTQGSGLPRTGKRWPKRTICIGFAEEYVSKYARSAVHDHSMNRYRYIDIYTYNVSDSTGLDWMLPLSTSIYVCANRFIPFGVVNHTLRNTNRLHVVSWFATLKVPTTPYIVYYRTHENVVGKCIVHTLNVQSASIDT
jgi:hypothetical protein